MGERDLYITGEESPDLELKAVIGILTDFLRKNRAEVIKMSLGILTDFLRKNRAEVIKMSLYEYDQEQHMKWLREEDYEQGHEDGKEDNLVTNIQALMKNMNISV